MANFSVTFTNNINVFGQGASSKWGQSNGFSYTMVWGTTKWGESSFNLVFNVEKLINDNSISIDGAYLRSDVIKILSNSVSTDFEASLESLKSGIWDIVFVANTTNAEERDFASYNQVTNSATSYTCQAAGSGNWS